MSKVFHLWKINKVWLLRLSVANFIPDEICLMRRCQVMATKVFDPAFLQRARQAADAIPA